MNRKPRSYADILLVILLAADLLFIVGHILFTTTSFVEDPHYSIIAERGFGETFQYIKAYWAVLLFLWLAIATRERSYLAWSAVFAYLGADDLLQIHEEGGNSIAIRYGYPEMLGLRERDLGELTVFAIAGGVLLILVAIAYYGGSDTFRRRSKTIGLVAGLLVAAGIVVDAVHIPFQDTIADQPLIILEDGGEMMVLSVVCWYTFRLLASERTIDFETDELPALGAEFGATHQSERVSEPDPQPPE